MRLEQHARGRVTEAKCGEVTEVENRGLVGCCEGLSLFLELKGVVCSGLVLTGSFWHIL